MTILETATRLARLGYHVVPLQPKTKAAVSKLWTQQRLSPLEIPQHFSNNNGIGLLTGVETTPGVFLVAIDIDVNDQTLIDRVRLSFDYDPPAKKGAKGVTFIARMTEPMKKRMLRRKNHLGVIVTAVEILASGQQTAIPPTVHPSGVNYQWLGISVEELAPDELPLLSASQMREIEIAVKNESSPIFLLNTMQWVPGGGGTIHNSVLTAVAAMVVAGWDDDDIWKRVNRATEYAVSATGDDYCSWTTWKDQVLRMASDARTKGYDKPKREDIRVTAAKWLLRDWRGHSHVYQRDGQIISYVDGHYQTHNAQEIRHILASEFKEPEGVSLYHKDWVAIHQTALDMAPKFPSIPCRKVCLRNGTYDMDTGALTTWSPDDYLISQLPFDYNSNAVCPTYERFLSEVFAGDPEIDLAVAAYEEFISHTLFESLEFHRFLVIKGQPRTGKSTLVGIAKLMSDPSAISAVPVHEFGNERYRTAMVGKLLNVVSEVAAMSHAADDFLKAVTAGDAIQVRFLYCEPQLVTLPTRLLIACNELFQIRDTSGAIQERMLLLTCNNYIEKKSRDVALPAKLRNEAPGIFNRIVKAWPNLRSRGHFVEPHSHEVATALFTLETNHALQWFIERTIQGGIYSVDPQSPWPENLPSTENSLLYLDFQEWAKNNGFKIMSSITWGTKLSQVPNTQISIAVTKKWLPTNKVIRVRPLTLNHDTAY